MHINPFLHMPELIMLMLTVHDGKNNYPSQLDHGTKCGIAGTNLLIPEKIYLKEAPYEI